MKPLSDNFSHLSACVQTCVANRNWQEVTAFCAQEPFLPFTNSMLTVLCQAMEQPSYQGEANDLLLFLLSDKGREINSDLRLKNNWLLWESISVSIPHHCHTDITKQFILLHDFSEKSYFVGRFAKNKNALPALEQALKTSNISSEVAFNLLRYHSYEKSDFVIVKLCFQKLDGKHYVQSFEQLFYPRSPIKDLCCEHLMGGDFLHNPSDVKEYLLPLVKSYEMQENMFWLPDEVMFVVLKDLYRTQPHMFTNLFENGIPDAFQKEIFAPLVTKALIEKELVGKGHTSYKKKM